MRTIVTEPGRSGPRVSRRRFLQAGALSGFGLGLPGFPTWTQAAGDATAVAPGADLACILVWLQGGASHLDSFDPKPGAPAEVRGPFAAISTRVPGIALCEHLPRLAQMQDRFAILRSLQPRNGSHGVAEATMLSGQPFDPHRTHPTYGSVVAQAKGSQHGLPPYVQLGGALDSGCGGGRAGVLGPAYDPVVVERAADLRLKGGLLDLDPEPRRVRERYGPTALGRGCLRARRLVEAGVRFVTVTDPGGGWDTHEDSFPRLATQLLPRLDLALSGLLGDLSDRGRLDSTLVLVLSDFGRTPLVNAQGGRDHWSRAGCALVAGAGLKGGQAVGRTDRLGGEPVETPCYPEDLAATLLGRLGLLSSEPYRTPDGREVVLANGGRMIPELRGPAPARGRPVGLPHLVSIC